MEGPPRFIRYFKMQFGVSNLLIPFQARAPHGDIFIKNMNFEFNPPPPLVMMVLSNKRPLGA